MMFQSSPQQGKIVGRVTVYNLKRDYLQVETGAAERSGPVTDHMVSCQQDGAVGDKAARAEERTHTVACGVESEDRDYDFPEADTSVIGGMSHCNMSPQRVRPFGDDCWN